MKEERDYKSAWTKPITKDTWFTFSRRICNGARDVAFDIIKDYLKKFKQLPVQFVEVGFGQTYDFEKFAKELHDCKKIIYTGYDITEQFVNFARSKYPGYTFNIGGFLDLEKNSFDISYTRHVLEHLDPNIYEVCLRSLLNATRKVCIVSWFSEPSEEKFNWEQSCGFGGVGAYGNIYSKELTYRVIEESGFVCIVSRADAGVIYTMERK